MAAILKELLTEEELKIIQRRPLGTLTGEEDIRDITVKQLADMALTLIRTEYDDPLPAMILPAECITILTRRAQEKHISIYT
jgi:hypothetical protein